MKIYVQLNDKRIQMEFKDFIKKFKVFENGEYLDSKIVKSINLKTSDLLIYSSNKEGNEYILFVEYSNNPRIAKIIFDYLNIKNELSLEDAVEYYMNNKIELIDPCFQTLVPSNINDQKEFFRVAKKYRISELIFLLAGKHAKLLQNVLE
jgi:hypothetical protein